MSVVLSIVKSMEAWLELQLSNFCLITYLLHYASCFTSPLMKMIWCIFRVVLVLEEESLWTLSELFLFSSIILTSSEGYICDKYYELCIWFTLADMSSQILTQALSPIQSPIWTSKTTQPMGIKMLYVSADSVKPFVLLFSILPFLYSFFYFLSLKWNQQRQGCV